MSSAGEDEGFDDIVAELDREEARVKVRMEMRRFRKPTTVVEGLKMNENEPPRVGHEDEEDARYGRDGQRRDRASSGGPQGQGGRDPSQARVLRVVDRSDLKTPDGVQSP